MKKTSHVPVPNWLSLDNAAKIYPAARTKNWMPLFRISILLNEEVDQEVLQRALEQTIKRIPLFAYRLRKGLFWHFFEAQDRMPRVEADARNPMLPINRTESDGFLFRLRCFKRTIALEIFHVLCDGAGALTFLTTLTRQYLILKHGRYLPVQAPMLEVTDPPRPEEWEDSFPKYARKATRPRGEESAWRLKGTREEPGFLKLVTGVVPTRQLVNVARERNTTVNNLLSALVLKALIETRGQSRRQHKRPVKLSVPVNLRRFYDSRTLRNFSFYVNVPVHTDYGTYSLDELIRLVGHYMGLETMEPLLNARFSANVKAEQNVFLRLAPLVVKNAVLKLMYRATGERYMTSTLTNLGQVNLPPEMERFIDRMELTLGPAQKTPLSLAVLSSCGKTCICFSKTIKEAKVEKAFFTSLIKLGVPVKLHSN